MTLDKKLEKLSAAVSLTVIDLESLSLLPAEPSDLKISFNDDTDNKLLGET
ncbi:MAG: hypothetical protein LC768_02700 [Acidobacteria bacterium]|nr:hypothetical protein [Acidobacteriota bacterium]MCA1637242.1 hypothetical protein [Acidobacteriota bacterium]